MGTKFEGRMALRLLVGLFCLSNAGGFKSYLRLVGYGCDKLNIISDDLKCPSEGNYSVAGACDRFVRCVPEKIKNAVNKEEPYMVFCELGENYVRGRCTKISDPYDCPQSHCKWVREDTPSQADITTTSSDVIVPTVTAEETGKPTEINKVVQKNQTSSTNANLKCSEIPHVKFEDDTTCPSEGKFVYIEGESIECDIFVSCKCQGGKMTSQADVCTNANETFNGENCVVKVSEEMSCPQKKCKVNEIQKPVNHSLSHNCPKVVLEDYPGDENSHGHGHGDEHHDHNHQSTSTVSVLQPNHALSSKIVPFFHSVILMLVSSLVL